jgi:ribonucleoside-diphosphate reductase subunit M2
MSPDLTSVDPILNRTDDRFVLFPVSHESLWRFYKQAQASYWTAEEIDLSEDVKQWQQNLTEDERHYLTHVLAFFAASDGIVMENLNVNFADDVCLPEARQFYAFQQAMEAVHAETYSLLISTLVKDSDEKARVFRAISEYPCVEAKARWAQRWIDGASNIPFCKRLIAFACVEGIFFSGSFCAIFWLKKRGLMPGVCFSNELISRDEGLHRDFACELHSKLQVRCSEETVQEIVREAVDIEKTFVTEALPVDLIGMNATQMTEYIEFVADHLLTSLGVDNLYGTTNPFDWMELISLQGKTNFFEKRVGEYQKYGFAASLSNEGTQIGANVFTTDVDF